MKVAIISKSTAEGGGASRVAQDLCAELNRIGYLIEATHWRGWGEISGSDESRSLYGDSGVYRKALKAFRVASRKAGIQEAIPLEWLVMRNSEILDADLIHVHDITDTLSPVTMRWLAQRKPLLWTLHDASPFTGGCLYPMGCNKYESSCHGCPQTKSWPISGAVPTPQVQLMLKRRLGQERFWISAPSEWLVKKAHASLCYPKAELRFVSNGIDTNLFKPGNKAVLREQLGLHPDKLTLVVSAGHLTDARKGIHDSIETVRRIASKVPVQVIAVGRSNPGLASALAGIPLVTTGYLTSMPMLSAAYAAGDALICCSYADNQPLTVLENLAVGNAVYAYATGGIPEITDARTGYVAPQKSIDVLAAKLLEDWQSGRLAQISKTARERAEAEFSLNQMAANFSDLYREILVGHGL